MATIKEVPIRPVPAPHLPEWGKQRGLPIFQRDLPSPKAPKGKDAPAPKQKTPRQL